MASNYHLEIVYDDNNDGIYYPGQTVTGQVQFTVSTTSLKLRGLILTIKGSGMCNYSKDFTAEQEFFVINRNLVGSKGADPTEVQPDVYTYNFSHRLPRNIPYSVDGVYGYIKYFASVTLDLPWDIYDKQVVKPFIVRRYEDLNYMSGMRDARDVITKKDIDSPSWIFWKGATGHVIIKGSIPQCGYAPGETINVDVEINNQSTVDIENVIISLQNVSNYVCQTPWTKLEKNTDLCMSEVTAQGVKAGYTAKIKEKVPIPESTPITSVMYCNVYQISYNVQVSIKFRRWNNNANLNIPVYIGSVGLKPVDENDKSHRIPPLWPPNHKVKAIDLENEAKDNAGNVDEEAAKDVNDNTTEEATD